MVPRITKLQSPRLQNRYWYYVHFRGKWRLHERKNRIHPLSLSISYSESPPLAPKSGEIQLLLEIFTIPYAPPHITLIRLVIPS